MIAIAIVLVVVGFISTTVYVDFNKTHAYVCGSFVVLSVNKISKIHMDGNLFTQQ